MLLFLPYLSFFSSPSSSSPSFYYCTTVRPMRRILRISMGLGCMNPSLYATSVTLKVSPMLSEQYGHLFGLRGTKKNKRRGKVWRISNVKNIRILITSLFRWMTSSFFVRASAERDHYRINSDHVGYVSLFLSSPLPLLFYPFSLLLPSSASSIRFSSLFFGSCPLSSLFSFPVLSYLFFVFRMAILVQPYLNGAELLVNGVAVTCNPFNRAKFGIYVSKQNTPQITCRFFFSWVIFFQVNAHLGGAVRSTDVNSNAPPEQTMIHLSRVPGAVDGELVSGTIIQFQAFLILKYSSLLIDCKCERFTAGSTACRLPNSHLASATASGSLVWCSTLCLIEVSI